MEVNTAISKNTDKLGRKLDENFEKSIPLNESFK